MLFQRTRFSAHLIFFITVIFLAFPKEALSVAPEPANEEMPTWIKVTIATLFTLSFGKWCWDKFHSESQKRKVLSGADSSSLALAYLLKGERLLKFKNLKTEKERQQFSEKYWQELDPYPYDTQNELKMEFEGRVREANVRFSTNYKKGWRTDKGRVYILYGHPDEIKPLPFSSSIFKPPYNSKYVDMEIWLYDRTGGLADIPDDLKPYTGNRLFFLFARLSGKAGFRQVYSSEIEELNDIWLFRNTAVPGL